MFICLQRDTYTNSAVLHFVSYDRRTVVGTSRGITLQRSRDQRSIAEEKNLDTVLTYPPPTKNIPKQTKNPHQTTVRFKLKGFKAVQTFPSLVWNWFNRAVFHTTIHLYRFRWSEVKKRLGFRVPLQPGFRFHRQN